MLEGDISKESNAYLLGGGVGSLAAAAFMIRDGGFLGRNISINWLRVFPSG